MRSEQYKIISELEVQPSINPSVEIENRTTFLSNYLGKTGLGGFVLGISGGQDSLLAGLLAQSAVQKLRENGTDASFHAVLLPYGAQADRNDALEACAFIQPDHTHDLDMQPAVDAFSTIFNAAELTLLSDFNKGNVKARMRMIAQYALAGQHDLLVVGTDHAAEAVTGFFTKYGDGGADILPLSGLTKRQGKALLRELGAPEHFITKPPTADLLDGNPAQADETELGISYDELDDYLEGKTISEDAALKIESRFHTTRHKRTTPIGYGAE